MVLLYHIIKECHLSVFLSLKILYNFYAAFKYLNADSMLSACCMLHATWKLNPYYLYFTSFKFFYLFHTDLILLLCCFYNASLVVLCYFYISFILSTVNLHITSISDPNTSGIILSY